MKSQTEPAKKHWSWKGYKEQVKKDKLTFMVYVLLRMFVVLAMIVSCVRKDYESLYVCVLSLILFMIPAFIEKNFGIELPRVLEVIILLFIFAAEILGEMESYYTRFAYWDVMLHTMNGFICAGIGFALTDILNRNEKIKFKLSPVFLAIVAFCFSMTIGVLWEFFEFFCDCVFKTDMQKDMIVNTISSSLLNPNGQKPVIIENILTTTVNGENLNINGYLDIGLFDTMKDLFVNFIGAVVFCIIGYFYVRERGKGRGKIAALFIPRLRSEKPNKTEKNKNK